MTLPLVHPWWITHPRARPFATPGPRGDISDPEADAVFAGYLERYEAGQPVFEDAVPTLRRARVAGLAVAVLTNGDEAQAEVDVPRVRSLHELVFAASRQ